MVPKTCYVLITNDARWLSTARVEPDRRTMIVKKQFYHQALINYKPITRYHLKILKYDDSVKDPSSKPSNATLPLDD